MRDQVKRGSCIAAVMPIILIVVAIAVLNQVFNPEGSADTQRSPASQNPASGNRPRATQTSKPQVSPTQRPKPTSTPLPLEATVKTTANFRSGPSTDTEIIGKLRESSSIRLLTKLTVGDSLWYRASNDGQEGWVSASLLNVESDTADRVPDELQTPALFASIPPQGDWCESGQTVWICAYNFRYPEKVGYQEMAKGARAIALVIQVKNTSNDDVYVSPNDFTIVMDDGRSYSYAPETFTYWDSAFEGITIAPGDKTIGGLLFVVSAKDGIERIISRNAQGDNVTIDLRNSPNEP